MTDADLQAAADVLGCNLLVIPEGCEEAFSSFLRAALGGGPRRDGPPYEHRYALPETEYTGLIALVDDYGRVQRERGTAMRREYRRRQQARARRRNR